MIEEITIKTHPSMFAWFRDYADNGVCLSNGKSYYGYGVYFKKELSYIKYPYDNLNDYYNMVNTSNMFLINSPKEIKDRFHCDSCENLLSFKGFPKKVGDHVGVWYVINNEQYSLNHKKDLDKYKIYLAMWLEMLDSVTEKERWEYINEYDYRNDNSYSIIPKEILLEFGVL